MICYGIWHVIRVIWCMVYGMVYATWYIIISYRLYNDMWLHVTWYLVHGTWYMVHGTWYMVHGTWHTTRDMHDMRYMIHDISYMISTRCIMHNT